MRLASLAEDGWELASGEERYQAHPEDFWMPPRAAREALARGKAAKLIFLVESVNEQGLTHVQGERMWVLVTDRRDGYYIGLLDNTPVSVDGDGDYHLVRGAEVAFAPEHVIEIGDPPAAYVADRLAQRPTRFWPPDEPPELPWAAG